METKDNFQIKSDKIMFILSYLGLLALVPLLLAKEDEDIKWHARQGLTLAVATLLIFLSFWFLITTIAHLPIVGWIIGVIIGLLQFLIGIGVIIISLFAIMKALHGERWRIPIIADIAERF
jgi:uncharacterized membrane protein